jgi:hypothetical protein
MEKIRPMMRNQIFKYSIQITFISALMFIVADLFADDLDIRDFKPVIKNMWGPTEQDREIVDFTMPLIMGKSPVAKRINTCMYFDEIEQIPPESLSSHIENFDYGLVSISYDIIRKDSILLSLSINSAGIGATYNEHTTYYNFDLKTGRYISAVDLFVSSKKKLFADRLLLDFQKEILKCYKEFNSKRPAERRNTDSIYYDKSDGWSVGDFGFGDRFGRFNPAYLQYLGDDFSIQKDSIIFIIESLSKYFDDVRVSYPFDSLSDYLSEYGKHIIFGHYSKHTQPFSVKKQVYYGLVGNRNIVLFFQCHSRNEVNGVYYYEKYKKPITVYGHFDGKELTLNESEGIGQKEKTVATIRATVINSGFEGFWSDSIKTLGFRISLQ